MFLYVFFFPHRLVAYLVSLNVEKIGWLSKVPRDYVYIETNTKQPMLYGAERPKLIAYENKLMTVRFRSDYFTMEWLNKPKGFLIYFKS